MVVCSERTQKSDDGFGGGFSMSVPNADDVYGGPIVPVRRHEAVLEVRQDGTIAARNFTISKTALRIGQNATEEDWVRVGEALWQMEGSMQFIIGDWLNYGAKFGYEIDHIAASINRDPKTLYNWSRVAEKFPETLRRETLFFGHFSLLAGQRDNVEELVNLAEQNQWTVSDLRSHIKSLKRRRGSVDREKKLVKDCRKIVRALFSHLDKLSDENKLKLVDEIYHSLEQYNG